MNTTDESPEQRNGDGGGARVEVKRVVSQTLSEEEKCGPDCWHTRSEHRAFDEGYELGRLVGYPVEKRYNPETHPDEADAFDEGAYAGAVAADLIG